VIEVRLLLQISKNGQVVDERSLTKVRGERLTAVLSDLEIALHEIADAISLAWAMAMDQQLNNGTTTETGQDAE
jgi:hypothetical protein